MPLVPEKKSLITQMRFKLEVIGFLLRSQHLHLGMLCSSARYKQPSPPSPNLSQGVWITSTRVIRIYSLNLNMLCCPGCAVYKFTEFL